MKEREYQSFSECSDRVLKEVTQTVENVLGTATYRAEDVPNWIDTISKSILEKLQAMSSSFKYIVGVIVLQRNNAGFHLFSTCYWDQSTDATVTTRWDNKTMHCVVTVYGIAY
eukprot:Polyplicarium_translucidae@DN526_c0_g1_i1.p1